MPFDVAPKTEEQQRVALGRIALEAIAAHILTLPPERFDLWEWVRSCGTVACAIGNSCELPEVRATGLTMNLDAGEPRCGPHSNWGAVRHALGIGEYVAYELFAAGQYPSRGLTPATEVSARIRAYLARTA